MRISDWSSDVCSSDLRSLRSSSFSSLRLFLRSAVSCALSAEVLPASIASNACFQASSCSGYRPCSRQYAERSASFIGAVWITAANLARASQRSGLEGLAGTTKPRDWNRSEEHKSELQSLMRKSYDV